MITLCSGSVFMNDIRYEIYNTEELMKEFASGQNEDIYKSSSFVRNKVSSFIQDLSLHIHSKKNSEYPKLFTLIHSGIYDKYTKKTFNIGVQYKIENDKIVIVKAKFSII